MPQSNSTSRENEKKIDVDMNSARDEWEIRRDLNTLTTPLHLKHSRENALQPLTPEEDSIKSVSFHISDFGTLTHSPVTIQHGEDEQRDAPETREETLEERLAREEDESEALARQLMAEEAIASYALATNFLCEDALSGEDLAAVQAAMEGRDDEEEEDLSYDGMLRLGERLGDVKQERWEMVAEKEIEKLPLVEYRRQTVRSCENDSLMQCLVCQCSYEEGDCMRELPCCHYFHVECVDQWLRSKDVCPYCRQTIVQENNA